MRRYFDSGDAFSGAGKKEDPLETGVEKRETLAVVQGQLDGESEAAKEAAEVARKNSEAEAAFKKKFGNVKPSAGALLHRQRKHEVCHFCVSPVLIVPVCVMRSKNERSVGNAQHDQSPLLLLMLLLQLCTSVFTPDC